MIGADQPASAGTSIDTADAKAADAQTTDCAIPIAAVLGEEFRLLHPGATPPADDSIDAFFDAVNLLPYERSALCLSGGGIRSACFALGVLQALARRRLLGRFHYLSTVSGGGYIGAWLTAWRHHAQDDDAVFDALAKRRHQPADAGGDPFAEPPELEGLRQNSNFLTPRLGVVSADTWTVAALCGRNLLLNWTIFGPLLLAFVMVPQGTSLFLGWAHFWPAWAHDVLVAAAAVALFLAILVTTANRPLNRPAAAVGTGRWPAPFGDAPVDTKIFILWILLPCYLAAVFLSIFTIGQAQAADQGTLRILLAGTALGAITYAAAWLAARTFGPPPAKPRRQFFAREEDTPPPASELLWLTVSGAAAGALIAIGVGLYRYYASIYWEWEILATFGIAWVMSSLLVADLLFTGLTSYARNGDFDREWSARSSGYLGVAGLVWFLFAGVVLFGPSLVGIGRPDINQPFGFLGAGLFGSAEQARDPHALVDPNILWKTIYNGIIALTGGISGVITMLLGNSAKTSAEAGKPASRLPLDKLLSLATIVFIFCLLTFLAALTASTLLSLEFNLGMMPPGSKLIVTVLATALCFCVGAGASFFVNVNRFSLHDIYRNRLIRAFLGSARSSAARNRPQTTDPFTGFSRQDNLPMSELGESMRLNAPGRLFPIVNMALNLVGGGNLAWQERKAETFTVSPLHSGNASVGFQPSALYGGPRGGVTLGTAMAISGAAASPNQGYHSSPIVALIMMLFNVRLGWWLGNPAKSMRIWRRDGPRWSFLPTMREMFGRTNDQTDWVYLSDGGHFENLGLYEMIRRRCRFIMVSDAGCDPACAYEDLGNALRKVWIDFGVRVEFESLDIHGRQVPPCDGAYCALARILYPEAPDRPGHLIYVKPVYYGTEPADVRAYALAKQSFPHETTADQWFSESQMESYRALGTYIVERMSAPAPDQPAAPAAPGDLTEMLARIRAYLHVDRAGTVPSAPAAEAAE